MQKKNARQEEFTNAITHGAGVAAGVVSTVVLYRAASYTGNVWYTFSVVVFGLSLILLYGCSCCYHACRDERIKRFLRKLDHSAIFVLIAGTYTPFALVTLRQSGNWGWPLFILIWSAAIFGIILSFSVMKKSSNLKTICYLVMGWSVLLVLHPLIEALSAAGHIGAFYWLLGGGAFYTFGTIFFFFDSYRYMHPLWHLFVLGGSLCHVVSIYGLV